MSDRVPVEAYVDGHWCPIDEEAIETVEHALGIYTRAAHPDLGDIWIVPAHFPLRGESKPARAVTIALPASFEVPRG